MGYNLEDDECFKHFKTEPNRFKALLEDDKILVDFLEVVFCLKDAQRTTEEVMLDRDRLEPKVLKMYNKGIKSKDIMDCLKLKHRDYYEILHRNGIYGRRMV